MLKNILTFLNLNYDVENTGTFATKKRIQGRKDRSTFILPKNIVKKKKIIINNKHHCLTIM